MFTNLTLLRIYLFVFSVIFVVLFFAPVALAVSIDITEVPTSISDTFDLEVSITGASTGTNFLKIDLYKDGTTNYFGETFIKQENGTDLWYGGSDGKSFFPISIATGGIWSGTVSGRIGEPTLTQFPEPGNYKLKIRRFTSSGNAATTDQQTPKDIQITTVIVTPSPSPQPTSTTTTSTNNLTPEFSITNVPSTLSFDVSFKPFIKLVLPNNSQTIYYLTGAFKKSDGSRYFGLTKSSSWVSYNSDDYFNQVKIITDNSGQWSGEIDFKIDQESTYYNGAGKYLFKVGRYTAGGSGPSWSNEKEILVFDNSTPQPQPLPFVTIKSSPTPVATVLKTASPSAEVLGLESSQSASIASFSSTLKQTPKPLTAAAINNQRSVNWILIGLGSLIILISGFTIVRKLKRG